MIAELKEKSGWFAAVAIGGNGSNGSDIVAGQGALYSEHFTTILQPDAANPSGRRRRGKR
jgi:hypothetical protein